MQEGVIKYRLLLKPGIPAPIQLCQQLEEHRGVLFRHGLVGRDPERYGGLGYGNLSVRHPSGGFVVTASQTGGLVTLPPERYTHVTGWDLARFELYATGVHPPSSEASSHAMVYRGCVWAHAVVHVHSPLIWLARSRLGMPETPDTVDYGSRAMAACVDAFVATAVPGEPFLFAMAGHEDGVMSFGPTLSSCVDAVLDCLDKARCLETSRL